MRFQRVGLGADRAVGAAARQRDSDIGMRATFPPDPHRGLTSITVYGDDDLTNQQPQQLLSFPNRGGVGVEHRPQVSTGVG